MRNLSSNEPSPAVRMQMLHPLCHLGPLEACCYQTKLAKPISSTLACSTAEQKIMIYRGFPELGKCQGHRDSHQQLATVVRVADKNCAGPGAVAGDLNVV